jgi:hypothetical protein
VFDENNNLIKKYYFEKSHGEDDIVFNNVSEVIFKQLISLYING